MDSRDQYAYGWSDLGERFHALKSGRRQGRVNMIAALCHQKLIAPFTVEGACNRTVFETWLEICLLPTLKIGQVVVMDNATFHQGGRILELIEFWAVNYCIYPLILQTLTKLSKEESWLKSRIRKKLDQFNCLRDALFGCFTLRVLTALAVAIAECY